MAQSRKVQFDINQNYGVGGDVRIVLTDEDHDIQQAITNTVETQIGSRIRNRDLGSDFLSILFEEFSKDTVTTALVRLSSTIERWVPRVQVMTQDSQITLVRNERAYRIRLPYRKIGTTQVRVFDTKIPIPSN